MRLTQKELHDALVARHGAAMQERLDRAAVGIAGLGGLGSNIAVHLARLGVGRLVLVDFDVVDITNLNRQHYTMKDIGIPKTLALQEQLDREQQGIKAVRNYGEAFRSRNVILLCAQYFAWSIGVYGFVLWLPSIIRSGGENMGMVEVGWLSSVPYLAATIAMIVVSWASDKMQNRKLFVWPLLLIGGLAFIGSWAVGANHFWVSYTLLVVAGAAMYAPYGPFFAIIPEMLPRNVAGGAMALINSMGALGSFCGSWFVGYLNGATGSPAASYIFMGVALFASVLLTLIVKPANNQNIPLGAHHA